MASGLALKALSLVLNKKIKSNFAFWKIFSCKTDLENYEVDVSIGENFLKDKDYNLICAFDENFPQISDKIKTSEKPFLFAFKGDISLIKNDNQNVAVIGVLNPTSEIIERENKIAEKLTNKNLNIVSGLALGCDTVAHTTCLQNNAKTIAILPTTFENIYPKENVNFVDEIVKNNGLVITEYFIEPANRFERIKRFIERDRLQAMFSKSVVLIASFIQGKGDSGSRHAMNKAKEYKKQRFVMFNEKIDKNNDIFELNKIEIENGAQVLTNKTMEEI